jgi:hypothetical protein
MIDYFLECEIFQEFGCNDLAAKIFMVISRVIF